MKKVSKTKVVIFSIISVVAMLSAIAVALSNFPSLVKISVAGVVAVLVLILQKNIINLWEKSNHILSPYDEESLLEGVLQKSGNAYETWTYFQTLLHRLSSKKNESPDIQANLYIAVRRGTNKTGLGVVKISPEGEIHLPQIPEVYFHTDLCHELSATRFVSNAELKQMAEYYKDALPQNAFSIGLQWEGFIAFIIVSGDDLGEITLDAYHTPLLGILTLSVILGLHLKQAQLSNRLLEQHEGDSIISRKMDNVINFLGILLHEIGTPLSALRMSIQTLEMQIDTMQQLDKDYLLEALQTMSNSIERILSIRQKMDRYFSTESETIEATPHSFTSFKNELLETAKETATKIQAIWKRSIPRTQMRTKVSPVLKQTGLIIYSQRTIGAYAEVIENAMRYSTHDAPIIITISEPDDEFVDITVSNSGETPKSVIRAVEMYKPTSAVKDYKHHSSFESGSGMGLSIAKRAVESDGGSFKISSMDGKTVVRISVRKQSMDI